MSIAEERERYIEELRDEIDKAQEINKHLRAQNAALLELVKNARHIINHAPAGGVPHEERDAWYSRARAAIAQAEAP